MFPPYTNFPVEDYEDNVVVRNGKEFQELVELIKIKNV